MAPFLFRQRVLLCWWAVFRLFSGKSVFADTTDEWIIQCTTESAAFDNEACAAAGCEFYANLTEYSSGTGPDFYCSSSDDCVDWECYAHLCQWTDYDSYFLGVMSSSAKNLCDNYCPGIEDFWDCILPAYQDAHNGVCCDRCDENEEGYCNNSSNEGVDVAMIAGICVAVVVVCSAGICAFVVYRCRRKSQKQPQKGTTMEVATTATKPEPGSLPKMLKSPEAEMSSPPHKEVADILATGSVGGAGGHRGPREEEEEPFPKQAAPPPSPPSPPPPAAPVTPVVPVLTPVVPVPIVEAAPPAPPSPPVPPAAPAPPTFVSPQELETSMSQEVEEGEATAAMAAALAAMDPQGEPLVAFLSHYKDEAGIAARYLKTVLAEQLGLVGAARGRVFLDSDNLHNLDLLLDTVRRSDNFVLLLTRRVFSRPWVLLEIHTAIQAEKELVLVNVVGRGEAAFDFHEARQYQRDFIHAPGVDQSCVELLEEHGVAPEDIQKAISTVLKKIAIDLDLHGEETILHAQIRNIIRRMKHRSLPPPRRNSSMGSDYANWEERDSQPAFFAQQSTREEGLGQQQQQQQSDGGIQQPQNTPNTWTFLKTAFNTKKQDFLNAHQARQQQKQQQQQHHQQQQGLPAPPPPGYYVAPHPAPLESPPYLGGGVVQTELQHFLITVPQGVLPGQCFPVMKANGTVVEVLCPPGAVPGTELQVQL